MADTASKNCFVICPIGGKDSAERHWSDDIFKNLIEPIATKFGYKAFRSIDENRPGEITAGIVENLIEADLVVADLTGLNQNVFYELAIRHWTEKPFIHIARPDTKLPFDVTAINVVAIDLSSFGAADAARDDLSKQFQAVGDQQSSFENPLSRYRNRKELKQRGDPMAQELVALRDAQERLARQIAALQYGQELRYTEPPSNPLRLTLGEWIQREFPEGRIPQGARIEMVPHTLPAGITSPTGGTPDSTVLVPRVVSEETPGDAKTGTLKTAKPKKE